MINAQFDDIELMRRIATHDPQAFRTIYQQYGKGIYSLAYRILQNATLAEEVTQDTFLKLWHHKTQWDADKGSLRNWLLAITHFTAIDRLRKERRQPDLHPDSIEHIEEVMSIPRSESGWQKGVVLHTLISQLPYEQAFLIDLAFFRGMSHTEIAEAMDVPLGTVKTRLRSGLHRLRELWSELVKQTSIPT